MEDEEEEDEHHGGGGGGGSGSEDGGNNDGDGSDHRDNSSSGSSPLPSSEYRRASDAQLKRLETKLEDLEPQPRGGPAETSGRVRGKKRALGLVPEGFCSIFKRSLLLAR